MFILEDSLANSLVAFSLGLMFSAFVYEQRQLWG